MNFIYIESEIVLIELVFFGALKKFFSSTIFFQIKKGENLIILRSLLLHFLKNVNKDFVEFELVDYAVFSNCSEILDDVYVIEVSQKLFVLSPASGG